MRWHPYAMVFPVPEGDDWERFQGSISQTNGNGEEPILYRVLPDGESEGIDGRSREKACLELGILPTYRRVELADDEVVPFILRRNVHRRHLTADLRRQLVTDLRSEGKSHRDIAETLNVPRATVARDLAGAPGGAPETVVGRDGKTYPAQREPGDDTEVIEQARAEEKAKPKNGAPLFDWRKFDARWGEVVRSLDELGRAYPNEKSSQEFAECQRHLGDFYRTWQQWQLRLTRSKA